MNQPPYNDKEFLSTVSRWLEECGEILVFVEAVASSPSPHFFRTWEQLQKKIEELSKFCIERLPYLSIYGIFALKNYDFPLRGIMDEAFVEAVIEMMSQEKGTEFLLMELGDEGYYYGASITEPAELLDDLDDYRGKEYMFGKFPKISATPIPGIQVEATFPIALE